MLRIHTRLAEQDRIIHVADGAKERLLAKLQAQIDQQDPPIEQEPLSQETLEFFERFRAELRRRVQECEQQRRVRFVP
jgi:hypothetical protein